MPSYATGNLRRVHYRKPSGDTGWKATWGQSGERSTKSWVQSKGWTYTHTTYTTTTGRQARDKPTQEQLKAQWQKQQGIKPTEPTEELKPKGYREYLGKGKDISKFGFEREKQFEPRPEKPPTFFDVERRAGKQAGLLSATTHQERAKAKIQDAVSFVKAKTWERKKEETAKEPEPWKFLRRGTSHWFGGVPDPEYIVAWLGQDWKTTERIIEQKQHSWFTIAQKPLVQAYPEVIWSFPLTQNVIVPAVASMGFGAGMGAFKATTWGGKTLLVSKGLTKAGKPLWTLTRAGAVESPIIGYLGYETGKSLLKDPYKTLIGLGFALPLSIPMYKTGFKWGMGKVQRWHGMSQLTSPLDRVRQKGIYESMDRMMKLSELDVSKKPFDITRMVERVDLSTATKFTDYYKAESARWMFGGRPKIGGSTSMFMGGVERSGKIPKGLMDWAMQRQTGTRPMIGKQKPIDIDLLIREMFGAVKRSSHLQKSHVIDIHGYKTGRYLWGGMSELPSTKGTILDPWLSQTKILPVRGLLTDPRTEAWGMTWTSPETFFLGKRMKSPTIWLESKITPQGYVSGAFKGVSKRKVMVQGMYTLKHEVLHQLHPRYREASIERLTFVPYPKLATAVKGWYKTGKFDFKIPMKVKTLSLKEQFIRKSISILPSEKQTQYRSYKDIPDWWDIGSKFKDTKLFSSMDKVVHPSKYPTPTRGWGERIITKIGGAKEPKLIDYGHITDYYYPKYTYPKYSTGALFGGYVTTRYKKPKQPFYEPPVKIIHKPIPDIPTLYPPSTIQPITAYKTPPYKTPKMPVLKIISKGVPPYKTPPYKPPKTPRSIPPVNKQLLRTGTEKRKKLDDVWNVWGKRYKFRKFDVPDLSKLLRGLGF